MKLYRARGLRGALTDFDPLDSRDSTGGPLGWRFNDTLTEILYAAEVESLAVLEVTVRAGWETLDQVLTAEIEIPDHAVVNPADLGVVLPSNWNARPVASDSRSIAREFLNAITALPANTAKPVGMRVPSVLSTRDHNVLLDPTRRAEYTARYLSRIPFRTLRSA